MTTNRQPTYIVNAVEGEGKNTRWTRIGAAWPLRKGEGFSIQLQALPISGRLVLLPPKAREDAPLPAEAFDLPG